MAFRRLVETRKQRHTAKRIFEWLRDEHGFEGGYTIIKDYVREHGRRHREVFVPLTHAPGHAQADFGEAVVVIGGVEQKAHFFALDPIHYLPLLERKIAAFEQAAPLAGWELPKAFGTLQKLMEARMLKAGWREYVQVLRLLESFEMEEVRAAVKAALQMGTISFDAVKHLVLCRIERRPPRLDLDVYPFLPRTTVQTTSPASYMCLTTGAPT